MDHNGTESALTVRASIQGFDAIIELFGDLDVGTVEDLRDAVDEVLSAGARRVCFDCADLVFVDSSGLRCFLDAQTEAPDGVGLVRPSHSLSRILEITSLDSMLPVFKDLDEMRASARQSDQPDV